MPCGRRPVLFQPLPLTICFCSFFYFYFYVYFYFYFYCRQDNFYRGNGMGALFWWPGLRHQYV